MVKHLKYQTKKGGASIYVTIFVALIISVVTLSFARLAISELSKSGDTDLNQSAYDSALAGVEDAKLAIAACLKEGHTLSECNIASTDPDDCNRLIKSNYVNRSESNGAVFLQEGSNNSGQKTSQAYTCVVVDEDLPDYLGELTSEYRVRMVPLKTSNPEDLKNLTSVVISWYDDVNGNRRSSCSGNDCYFNNRSNAPIPPVISVSILQAGENFNRDTLTTTSGGHYGNVVLYPNGASASSPQIVNSDQFKSYADGGTANKPISINCYSDDSYACSAELKLPNISSSQRFNNSTYLIVAMPYDNISTAFRVVMKNGNSVVNFYDAQVAVDSTGRANDIYRRIATRVDLLDIYFPYPLYGLETVASGSGGINKNFWTTRNCWSVNDGNVNECANSGS